MLQEYFGIDVKFFWLLDIRSSETFEDAFDCFAVFLEVELSFIYLSILIDC